MSHPGGDHDIWSPPRVDSGTVVNPFGDVLTMTIEARLQAAQFDPIAACGAPIVPSHAEPGVSLGGFADVALRSRAGACNAFRGVPDKFLIACIPPVASSVAAGLITSVVVTARLDPVGRAS